MHTKYWHERGPTWLASSSLPAAARAACFFERFIRPRRFVPPASADTCSAITFSTMRAGRSRSPSPGRSVMFTHCILSFFSVNDAWSYERPTPCGRSHMSASSLSDMRTGAAPVLRTVSAYSRACASLSATLVKNVWCAESTVMRGISGTAASMLACTRSCSGSSSAGDTAPSAATRSSRVCGCDTSLADCSSCRHSVASSPITKHWCRRPSASDDTYSDDDVNTSMRRGTNWCLSMREPRSSPHSHTSPRTERAAVHDEPQRTSTMCSCSRPPSTTRCGSALVRMPRPSSPNWFEPNVYTSPPAVTTAECVWPAASCRTTMPCSALTRTGCRTQPCASLALCARPHWQSVL
mmetsp:Transcript_53865/g.132040  ORF Transcript_53865/g.132040 Transcript_53865/m.132040 type:complete len:352 (+) Transcript_53865:994-2049(+)